MNNRHFVKVPCEFCGKEIAANRMGFHHSHCQMAQDMMKDIEVPKDIYTCPVSELTFGEAQVSGRLEEVKEWFKTGKEIEVPKGKCKGKHNWRLTGQWNAPICAVQCKQCGHSVEFYIPGGENPTSYFARWREAYERENDLILDPTHKVRWDDLKTEMDKLYICANNTTAFKRDFPVMMDYIRNVQELINSELGGKDLIIHSIQELLNKL